jgi:hypothetical protein|tara:strand:- start:340 stop:1083 length:744 start_codon:yes stop_codon:yes gene_type:complete
MSFPHTIYGKFGDEKETSTSKRRALGTVLELPDGRQFKYALNGGSEITSGKLVASKVMVANHDMDLVTAVTAAGSQTVTVTLGNTATTLNQYQDGYLYTNDGTGEGQIYRIKSNPVASGNATCEITLDDNDKIAVALDGTTLSGLLENPYNEVVVSPTSVTCRTVGVTATDLAASEYGYVQTKGLASVLVSGTVVAGEHLRVAGATTAGAAMALDRDGSGENEQEIGVVHNVVAVTTDYCLAFLNID